jgi:hypothetical protein
VHPELVGFVSTDFLRSDLRQVVEVGAIRCAPVKARMGSLEIEEI